MDARRFNQGRARCICAPAYTSIKGRRKRIGGDARGREFDPGYSGALFFAGAGRDDEGMTLSPAIKAGKNHPD